MNIGMSVNVHVRERTTVEVTRMQDRESVLLEFNRFDDGTLTIYISPARALELSDKILGLLQDSVSAETVASCTCGADRTGPSAEAHAENCPAGN